jgi:hypothetical protein
VVEKETDRYVHQKKYNVKMEAKGLCRVTVWVPKKYSEKVTDFAQKLRKQK